MLHKIDKDISVRSIEVILSNLSKQGRIDRRSARGGGGRLDRLLGVVDGEVGRGAGAHHRAHLVGLEIV